MNIIVSSVGFQAILEKYLLILRVRSRIEELERCFLRSYMLSWSRFDKWNMILRGDIRDLKKKGELRRCRASIAVIETIVALYGELSDAAAHGITHPNNYDEASIVEMLNKFGITPINRKLMPYSSS